MSNLFFNHYQVPNHPGHEFRRQIACHPARFFQRNLHTQAFDWNLGSEAHNPLFGLPEPLQAPLEELPEDPFRYLERYGRKDAEIFFGRGREIRQLFSLLTSRQDSPLILFYGQSGVGKSSVLEAGLFPRLEARSPYLGNRVIYGRRDQEKGLLGSLKAELAESLKPYTSDPVGKMVDWPVRQLVERRLSSAKADREEEEPSRNPFFQVPRLVILLDQAEEAFTRPMNSSATGIQQEWHQLLKALSPVILNHRYSTDVKIILSYRKEYHPEIRAYCQRFGLNWEEVFLRPLDEQGIREVAMGIQSTERLREKYRVAIQEFDANGQSLPASIAEDLLEDKYSAIAPILQIQLSELWDLEKPKKEGRAFTYDKYKKMKREGEGKLEKFFLEQMQKLWKEQGPLTPYVHAGLALDLLRFHTTEMGTAAQHRPRSLFDNYIGNENGQDGRAGKELLQAMADRLADLRLLLKVDGGATRLAHDTLAPYVRKAFAFSDLPGQRAAHILESKINQPAGGMPLAAAPQEPVPPPETDRLAIARRLDALREKIEALAAAKTDDSDPLLLDPANLRIIEEGKIGMRKWNEQEQVLVEYIRNIQNKAVRKTQGNRLVMVGLGIVMAGMIFWGFRNLAAMWEREDMLNAYQYLAQADEELERGNRENALRLASQAYLYNFPNDVSPILKRIVIPGADSTENPGALEWIGAIPEPLEQAALSPDGRFAVTWGGNRRQTGADGSGRRGPENPVIRKRQCERRGIFPGRPLSRPGPELGAGAGHPPGVEPAGRRAPIGRAGHLCPPGLLPGFCRRQPQDSPGNQRQRSPGVGFSEKKNGGAAPGSRRENRYREGSLQP